MNFVIIGRIIDTFGVKGYLKVLPLSKKETFKDLKRIFLKRKGGDYIEFRVENVNFKGDFVTLKIKGYETPEEAQIFKDAHIHIPEEELPPTEKDEFYYYQLVGITVKDSKGKVLGKIKAVHDIGSYHLIELEDKKTYIPFVSEIVKEVNISKGEMIVDEKKLIISSS